MNFSSMQFRCLIFTIILAIPKFLTAQANIPVGSWRAHQGFGEATTVDGVNDGRVFVGTKQGMFIYNYNDQSIETYNKVNGLSDVSISCLRYSEEYNTLLIAYENGNIDFFEKGRFTNLSALKDKIGAGSKRINHIFLNGRFAYLSCGFGIIQVDLERKEIRNSYIIGPNASEIEVFQIAVANNLIVAATQLGVYTANLTGSNLSDFNSWVKSTTWNSNNSRGVTFFKDKFYVIAKDTIMEGDGFNWTFNTTNQITNPGIDLITVRSNTSYLTLVNNFKVILVDTSGNINQIDNINFQGNLDVWMDFAGTVWLATNGYGLVNSRQTGVVNYLPRGPLSGNANRMSHTESELWVASGGYNVSFNNLFSRAGFHNFSDGNWTSYTPNNIPELSNTYDFIVAKQNPITNKTFVGMWNSGVVELTNKKISTIYNSSNSSLENVVGINGTFVRIGGIDFDKAGNTWFTNYGASKPLSRLSINGTWTSFNSNGFTNELLDILIDDFDQKWIRTRNSGILVMNRDNSNFRLLGGGEGNGNLPSNSILSMAKSTDGSIWVGTDRGPAIFYNPGGVFGNQNIDAQRIKIQQGEFVEFLLGSEVINAIGIDGGNRKWFATLNGVFLVSEDGLTLISHFTEQNSPLLSNTVLSLSVNQVTGEVFFGTDQGMISYRGTATGGNLTSEQVLVFPNPVRKDFNGLITVSGLVEKAFVKITDISGNLVHQTRAQGGTVTWDGTHYSGYRVQTGVYLVFTVDALGVEKKVAKILFLN